MILGVVLLSRLPHDSHNEARLVGFCGARRDTLTHAVPLVVRDKSDVVGAR